MISHVKYLPIEASAKKEAVEADISKVLVALSGGADSIAAAFSLKSIGLDLMALHCNFHLRDEESNRDMDFVKSFCGSHNIPLLIKEFDVHNYIENNKGASVEMACRDLRYDWFNLKLKETGFQRIVTGHNADDNIETFFLNVLRGSGSRGLKGMVKDNGVIWRPLLPFHRKDILEYLKDKNLDYVVDSTNLLNDYRRNFLRNKVIPLLKEEWKGFDTALDKTIKHLYEENNLTEDILRRHLPPNGQPLNIEIILDFPAPLLLINRFIAPLSPFSTTAEEVYAAIKANKPHIRKWRLRNGWLILRNRRLFIEMSHSESSS